VPFDRVFVALSDQPRLVVLRALGLGDLLTSLPALRALSDAFPGHERVLAAPRALAPLALMTGSVHRVVDTAPLASLPAGVRRPDTAVNLHGRGPQSHRVLLAARPGTLIAFAHEDVPESTGGPPWDPNEHEVGRWCRLLRSHGIAADPSRLDLPIERSPRAEDVGPTVIHPGAAFAARRWPAERWAAVAAAETRSGRRVVVTGTTDEVVLARAIADRAGLGSDAVVAGTTDMVGLARLVANAERVVCGDTGIAHLATAVGTPSVVLFGPERPSRWGPPPDRPWHRALWAGRTGDPRSDRPDAGLLAIEVADVLGALEALDRTAAPVAQ
jgi:ADP-heptose:LPS heptosyltransferase